MPWSQQCFQRWMKCLSKYTNCTKTAQWRWDNWQGCERHWRWQSVLMSEQLALGGWSISSMHWTDRPHIQVQRRPSLRGCIWNTGKPSSCCTQNTSLRYSIYLTLAAEMSLYFQSEAIDIVDAVRGIKTFFQIIGKLKESSALIFSTCLPLWLEKCTHRWN